jgi:hypothetical protein
VKIRMRYREETEVSFLRWLEYHTGAVLECIGTWMCRRGNRMIWHAFDPDDEVPF